MPEIIEHHDDVVMVRMTELDYVRIGAALRELLAEMEDAELSARVGASRAEVSELCRSWVQVGRDHGIEE
ncbi:MAG TPA: hypothetical protein VHL98_03590 [Microvirga sp.]|jgi:hypothetical protein|nr:hypothetical protein [Microvirga sp.]